jgi:CMP-N-acetylneuraminic acid synthetase
MFSHNRDTTLDTTSTLKTRQIAQALQALENPTSSNLLSATEGKRRKDATLREEGECSHEESNLKPSDP